MLIHRETRRLHKKYVRAANILEQLKVNLSIREPLQASLAHRNSNELADLLAQRYVRGSAKNLHALVLTLPRSALFLRCLRLSAGLTLVGEHRCRLGAGFCLLNLTLYRGKNCSRVLFVHDLKPPGWLTLNSSCCFRLNGALLRLRVLLKNPCCEPLKLLRLSFKTSDSLFRPLLGWFCGPQES